MRYPAYPEYVDSGVDWIGIVPATWRTVQIKRKFHIVNGSTPQASEPDYWDGEIVWFTPADFKFANAGTLNISSRQITLEGLNSCGTSMVPCDSIIITTRAPIGNVAQSKIEACTNQGCKSIVAHAPDIHERFFYHLLTASSKQLNALGLGTTFMELSSDDLGCYQVAQPPLQEQAQIAAFLDWKASQIDALIAKKQKLIARLKEKHLAVITQAVTKGLNPDAPMQDSGVEWLGKVPKHWPVKRVKFLTRILRGQFSHRPRNDPAFYDGDYPFVQTGDIARAGKFVETFSQTLNERGLAVSKQFPEGTLVMTIAANIGDMAIIQFAACFPDSIVGFVPEEGINLDFLYYMFVAMKQRLMMTAVLNTQLNLNIDRIASLNTISPPIEEQLAIVDFLNEELQHIQDVTRKAESAISKLAEYRTALITAAVTGKIDVRNIKVPSSV